MMAMAVYISIFIGFLRRLLRNMLAPSRRLPDASRDIPVASGNKEEYALFLVKNGWGYYVISGTTHEMDEKTSNWLSAEVRREWNDSCRLIQVGLLLHVMRTGSIDKQIYELEDRLDTVARARLRWLVNGARATYNDKWRWGL